MLQHNNIALTAMLNNSKSTSFYRASFTVPHISNSFKTSLHEYLTEHCKSMCDKELILIKFPIKLAFFSFSGNNRLIRGEGDHGYGYTTIYLSKFSELYS